MAFAARGCRTPVRRRRGGMHRGKWLPDRGRLHFDCTTPSRCQASTWTTLIKVVATDQGQAIGPVAPALTAAAIRSIALPSVVGSGFVQCAPLPGV